MIRRLAADADPLDCIGATFDFAAITRQQAGAALRRPPELQPTKLAQLRRVATIDRLAALKDRCESAHRVRAPVSHLTFVASMPAPSGSAA